MTVLLVEDFKVVRERLANLLREQLPAPVEVLEAATPTDAMLLLRARQPNAVLLDIQLEQGSGFDVLEKMRAQSLTTPVVVLTNHSTPQCRERCLRAGARAFFDKSLEFDPAVAAVGQLAWQENLGNGSVGSE